MSQSGKVEQIRRECDRLSIDVLGIAETHWISNGSLKITDGWSRYYPGGVQHYAGVGFMVSPITEVCPVSDRIIRMRMDAKPQPINIIQVYMPTSTSEDEEVFKVYAETQKVVDMIPKKENLRFWSFCSGRKTSKIGVFAAGAETPKSE